MERREGLWRLVGGRGPFQKETSPSRQPGGEDSKELGFRNLFGVSNRDSFFLLGVGFSLGKHIFGFGFGL